MGVNSNEVNSSQVNPCRSKSNSAFKSSKPSSANALSTKINSFKKSSSIVSSFKSNKASTNNNYYANQNPSKKVQSSTDQNSYMNKMVFDLAYNDFFSMFNEDLCSNNNNKIQDNTPCVQVNHFIIENSESDKKLKTLLRFNSQKSMKLQGKLAIVCSSFALLMFKTVLVSEV